MQLIDSPYKLTTHPAVGSGMQAIQLSFVYTAPNHNSSRLNVL